jgi:hypothetical protein
MHGRSAFHPEIRWILGSCNGDLCSSISCAIVSIASAPAICKAFSKVALSWINLSTSYDRDDVVGAIALEPESMGIAIPDSVSTIRAS